MFLKIDFFFFEIETFHYNEVIKLSIHKILLDILANS
jgi:hypothetical protein